MKSLNDLARDSINSEENSIELIRRLSSAGMSYQDAINAGRALVNAVSQIGHSAQEISEVFNTLYQKLGGNGIVKEYIASAISKKDANKIITKAEEKENNLARPDTGEQKEPHEIFEAISPEFEIPVFSDEEWNKLVNFNIDL